MESIPKQIGRYDVDRLLGAGAMGLVYLGRDPELDRPVAVKTVRNLDLDPEAKATFLERFRNEARAAARLHHPSIVQVYDVGEDDRVGPFLVFEYVPGSSLKQVLRRDGPLDPERLLRLASQVADALDVAHAAGIIHRDIKPDNLLITADERTKLADFGVARVPNAALTREGQFLGTPCYAAPETVEGARYAVASDLFSFAAVLYEALTGVRAFPGDDAVAVAHRVVHEDPPPPSRVARDVPPELDEVLLRGLAKRAADRPTSARELVAELAEALHAAGRIDERVAASVSAGATWRSGRGHRSPGAGAFFGVLVGTVAAAVGLVYAFSGDGADRPDRELAGLLGRAPDAGSAAATPGTDAGRAPGPADADVVVATDAAPEEPEALDGGAPPDAGPALPATAHEREEAAKDALDRARRAADASDWDAALRALGEARRFDPENPDIDGLAELVRARRSTAGP